MKARQADSTDIFQIESECFSNPVPVKIIEHQMSDPIYHLYVAVADGCIIGYAGFYCVLDEGYITNVAVLSSHRGNHISDGLMDILIRTANELKLSFLTLEVRETNEVAKGLYIKHGFTFTGVRKDYYSNPKENGLIMTKFLK